MRPACVLCALKHIGQACVLLLEARKGYPEHYWLALAHLAEAEDELVEKYPGLVEDVRKARKDLERDPAADAKLMDLIMHVSVSTGYDASEALAGAGIGIRRLP